MPARLFDINLQSAEFPFLSTDINRTTILADIPEPLPYNSNIVRPQCIYMKNVLPSKYGYDSLDILLPFSSVVGTENFLSVIPFYDIDDNAHLLGVTTDSTWLADDGITQWVNQTTGYTPSTQWTYCRLLGYPFFCATGVGIFNYDITSDNLIACTVNGVTAANLKGITSAAGYMIAWDSQFIYYTTAITTGSSPMVIDFTPVLGTAGAFQITDLRGNIECVLPIQNGFIVYSKENACANLYSGNPDFPFTTAEILGSSGVLTQNQVVGHENLGYHYAWTRNGLQQVAPSGATNVFPEFYDFMQMKTTEVLDIANGIYTQTVSTVDMVVQLALLGKRYLCISYAPQPSSGAPYYVETCIFDTDLKRWGKIVNGHRQVFEYIFSNNVQYETYNDLSATTYNALSGTSYAELIVGTTPQLKYVFGYLHGNGTITTYSRSNMLDGTTNAQSQLVLGKVKFYKVGTQSIQELYMDQVQPSGVWQYTSYGDDPLTIDLVEQGANITNENAFSGLARRYGFDSCGYWQQWALGAKFSLKSVSAFVNRAGKY